MRSHRLYELQWIASGYFHSDEANVWAEGWLATGDLGHIDPDGFLTLTDRSKDIIKSGGEWISSIELENAAIGHPSVAEAAVIGVLHHKWQERPLLLVQLKPGKSVTPEALFEFLAERLPHWWTPDAVVFVQSLPHTATGKLYKVELRKKYRSALASGSKEGKPRRRQRMVASSLGLGLLMYRERGRKLGSPHGRA